MVSKFSDAAVGLSEDRLGFRDYADGVIATLESLSKEDTPFTIGIFGSWGSGKTSFMQIMQELLEHKGYKTIFFKSWEYGNEEKPWIPFMITVVDKLFKDEIDKKELIRNIFLFSTDVVLQTYTQGKISTGDIIKVYKGSRKTSPFKDWSDEDAKIVIERVTKIEEFKNKIKERAEESCLFSINISVLDKLFHYCKLQKKMNNDSIPERMKKKFETEGFQLSDTATIRKERDDEWAITNGERTYIVKKEDGKIKIYEDFEKKQKTSRYNPKVYRECNRKKGKSKYPYKESPKGKIIIFIDDLDRIPEEKIVDFLDSLKIFLDISGCIFVLGCDYEILKNALRKKHGEEEIYKDYFDKIVQTDFYVPKISEQAIKKYLQFLTGWDAKEIEECAQLVIHSIGGNPRKIKRVVNATMLIKSVVEKRLGTSLQAFERPKPVIPIGPKEEVKEEELEEAKDLKRKINMTPAEVFDHLFEEKVLFKLACMREQWPIIYEDILSEEKKQKDLISFQDGDIRTDSWEYTELFSTAKALKALEENVKKLSDFLQNLPRFQGDTRFQRVASLKTYLTLLEISSPEAGISSEYTEPAGLPINLFNRYMLFEYINRGKVEKTDIEEKVKQEDWENNLSSYAFFFEVIRPSWNEYPLQELFKNNCSRITTEIKSSTDLWAIGRLLGIMREVAEETARSIFNETSDKYAEKIRACSDPYSIGRLLFYVRKIDERTAKDLLNETKKTYAEKIRACSGPKAIWGLLYAVREIKEEIAEELLNETWKTYAEKIRACSDPEEIKLLLDSVGRIKEETAEKLLNETWNTYVEKIKDGTDLYSIGRLLFYVREIEEEIARVLLDETWKTYAEKIKDSTDPYSIERLLFVVRKIEKKTAQKLLHDTKDTIAEKIKASTDPGAIGLLLYRVSEIEKETARVLLDKTKDTYADKIIASSDPAAIGRLLSSVSEIEEETARELLNETSYTYADKIIASSDPRAISGLLYYAIVIEEQTARDLFNRTKETYAKKIIASMDPEAIGLLLYYVRVIEEETAKEILKKTSYTYADKIRASTDPAAIGRLLSSVREIDKKTAGVLLDNTCDTYAEKIRDSPDPDVVGRLLGRMRAIDKKTAGVLLDDTCDTYAKKIRDSTDPGAIGALFESVREIKEETARELLNKTKDMYAEKIIASPDLDVVGRLLDRMREIDKKTAGVLLNETKKTYAEKIKDSTDLRAIGGLLDSVREIDKKRARKLINKTKKTYAEKIKVSTDTGAIGALLESVREIDKETAKRLEKKTKLKSEEK